VAEGGYPEVDHMPGPVTKRTQTGCKRCHGKGYVYKTPDGQVHPMNRSDAKTYKCGKCGGIGFVKVAEQGVTEMDGDGAGRSGGEHGKEHTGKVMKAKDVAKQAGSILGKAFTGNYSDEAHPIRDDGNEGRSGKQRYPGMKEGYMSEDEEIDSMALGELKAIAQDAKKIYHVVKNGTPLEAWMYKKITNSNEALTAVAQQVDNPAIREPEDVSEAEGEPEGVPHLSKELIKHIIKQVGTEGAHAIVKSLEWGDGAAKELLQLIKQDLEKNVGMAEEQVNEKSKSQAQFRTMAAVAHNPKFAKKVGISQKVGKEFHSADKKSNYKSLPKKVDEAEVSEDKLSSDLYKDFQTFKKSADKDIGSKAKDREIQTKEDCWDGYQQIGMKKKGGKTVPNCVPKK
jgi:hypothetical protein